MTASNGARLRPEIAIATAAQLACLLEVSAPKPGNVSPGRHFADARYEDFLASAAAIGGPIAAMGERSLGATIDLASEATAEWSSSNTNLGIVLLLTPLAYAAQRLASSVPLTIEAPVLRTVLREVLDETTVDDARAVYAAIRRTAPGGLGRAEAQDVADQPTVTLLEAMELAVDRDGIAREYATGFETTFTIGVPALDAARTAGLTWDDAVVETFLTIVAIGADTHIVRRGGTELADAVTNRARAALAQGGVRSSAGRLAIEEMDAALRRNSNLANPGTSADLTAAAIFVALLGGGWRA